jgi:GMP synthase (glutamine-hydrolysing)
LPPSFQAEAVRIIVPNVLAIRHVAFEDLGILEDIFTARGWSYRYHEAGTQSWATLDPLSDDLVVVLGGPVAVYDAHLYPFITEELKFLEQRLAARKATLGLCLGAQLIAKALGARVYPAAVKEIGWSPLQLKGPGHTSPCKWFSAEYAFMFHWHGDTFDLPDDAVLLASTGNCPNQVFVWNDVVLAFQCHPEVRARDLENWFIGHAVEIAATPGVNARLLREDTRRYGPALEKQGRLCFEEWLNSLKIT